MNAHTSSPQRNRETTAPTTELSIIIIARNEAKHIEQAITSVLRAIQPFPHAEVILVDSASTDDTVTIARRYPITIARLRPSWPLSAAAARYIGMKVSRGTYLMHLDGDMELDAAWLPRALPVLKAHPQAAGVDGYYRNLTPREGQPPEIHDEHRSYDPAPVPVRYFTGAALYRRAALEAVGGFNPYLISEEEPELCIRLRGNGYQLLRLPYLMGIHYGPPINSWDYTVRRLKRNLWVGFGQVPRYHLRSPLLPMVLRERTWRTLVYLGGVLGLLLSVLLGGLMRNPWLPAIAWGGALMAFAAWSYRKRSLRAAWQSLVLQTLVAYSAIRGFMMPPRPPHTYPTDAEIIQRQPE